MRVKVKLVVFKHPKPETWRTYASYCPALKDYCSRGNTVKEVLDMETRILLDDLKGRLKYNSLLKCGWKVSENLVIPPIFVEEDAVKRTEELFDCKIEEPIIVELDVELPPAEI